MKSMQYSKKKWDRQCKLFHCSIILQSANFTLPSIHVVFKLRVRAWVNTLKHLMPFHASHRLHHHHRNCGPALSSFSISLWMLKISIINVYKHNFLVAAKVILLEQPLSLLFDALWFIRKRSSIFFCWHGCCWFCYCQLSGAEQPGLKWFSFCPPLISQLLRLQIHFACFWAGRKDVRTEGRKDVGRGCGCCGLSCLSLSCTCRTRGQ